MWSWRKELHVQCPFLSLSSCLLRQILSQNVWLVFFQIGWKPHWLSFFHYKYLGECVQIWVCVVWGSAWVYVCGVSVYICECVWCGGVLECLRVCVCVLSVCICVCVCMCVVNVCICECVCGCAYICVYMWLCAVSLHIWMCVWLSAVFVWKWHPHVTTHVWRSKEVFGGTGSHCLSYSNGAFLYLLQCLYPSSFWLILLSLSTSLSENNCATTSDMFMWVLGLKSGCQFPVPSALTLGAISPPITSGKVMVSMLEFTGTEALSPKQSFRDTMATRVCSVWDLYQESVVSA